LTDIVKRVTLFKVRNAIRFWDCLESSYCNRRFCL